MERKNQLVFVLLIAVVIAAAILASFGPALFSGERPWVVLPEFSTNPELEDPDPDVVGGGRFTPVDITIDTVQTVIATLERPISYYRSMMLETFSGEKRYQTSTQVWVDGGWTRVDLRQDPQPRGAQHTLVGLDVFYRWYGTERAVIQGPADRWDADLAQRIPSYQDIIEIDPSSISDTSYVEKDGLPCIYVEVMIDDLGYAERYWVSVDEGSRGLLMAAETRKNGELILRMTSTVPESPVPVGAWFSLPDGTVLHQSDS